ncbi:MAG: ParB/RepB/Spo0J family partition protein [Longimicrobiales bacterium]
MKDELVPLSTLTLDPALPPRIGDAGELERLKESMQRFGLVQALVARPSRQEQKGEASHAVVVGSRRYLAAQALGWTEIRVTIRDMDDAEALAIAIESDDQSQPRTQLEHAWFYAQLANCGVEQKEIARRMGCSAGKANMYVRVGSAFSPGRIVAAAVPLEQVAALPVTCLREIARRPPEELGAALKEAVASASSATSRPRSDCQVRTTPKTGRWCAQGDLCHVGEWSADGRQQLVEFFGPLVDDARAAEGLVSPAEAAARAELLERHRMEVTRLREQHAAELAKQAAHLAELAGLLGSRLTIRAGRPSLAPFASAVTRQLERVRALLGRLPRLYRRPFKN